MSSKTAPEPRRRRPWPLAARLAAWYAGTAFLLVLLATGFWYWVLATNLDREDDDLLVDKVQVVRMLLREAPEVSPALRQEVEWESAARQNVRFYIRILGPDGRSIVETRGMREELPAALFPDARPNSAELGEGTEVESPAGRAFRVLTARAVTGGASGKQCTVQIALDRSLEEDLLAGYRGQLGLVLGTALVLCTLS